MVCIERTIGHKQFWTHPMELVSDVGRVEYRFSPFGDSITVSPRLDAVYTEHTIGIEIILDDLDQTPM
jgi:hypothetical protein